MATTLRELDRKGEIVVEVASRQPTSREEALAAYAECRAKELKRALWDMDATSEWRARDISYQCAALAEIGKRLGGGGEKKATKKARNVVQIAPSRSPRQQQIDLATVLQPEARETLYAPVLLELKDEAEIGIMKQENVRANQAMGAEVDEFVRFLYRVEDGARQARAALDQERRGGVPRDPRQVSGGPVRVGM